MLSQRFQEAIDRVLLGEPLGMIGAIAAALARGMPNDVYFKVGMITVVGLYWAWERLSL